VIDDRMITGTLFEQIDEGIDFIHKNINVEFVMTGKPERDQIWDYPLEALREALINAVCHRDYTILSHIEIRIYDERLVIWSPGHLPFGITLEELYKPHSSTLRNKGLAEVFYDTELIEQWGSGIDKMQKYCLNAGLPGPIFEEYQGFQVVFRKDIYNEDYLQSLNINERQIKAVMHVKKNGKITNKEYQEICNTSARTSSRDLADLVSRGLFDQKGTIGKGTEYTLIRQIRHKSATYTPNKPSDKN
jgi:ATP-dependent DNA helicase RecG